MDPLLRIESDRGRLRWRRRLATTAMFALSTPSIALGLMIVAWAGGLFGHGGTIVFLSVWAFIGAALLIVTMLAEGFRPASNAHEWTSEQIDRLVPAWLDVATAAGVVESDYVLSIDESTEVRAYARGRWAVHVSSEAVRQLREPQLRAMLAHELGHLLSTRRNGASVVAGWCALPLHAVPRLAIGIARKPADLARHGGLLRVLLLCAALVVYLSTQASVLVVLLGPFHAFIAALLLIMELLAERATRRYGERLADRVAVDLGFGDGLLTFFREHGRDNCFGLPVRPDEHRLPTQLFAPLSAYPLTRKRIRAIESRMSAHARGAD
ncbi:M48 family metalloprotease [Nocardia sp. NPDC057668]|uniref:M48 family metalloprotease n=1 Tax=Nocardia sp. NPDC057668 TaxID=3346202 RepID=UPI003671CF79